MTDTMGRTDGHRTSTTGRTMERDGRTEDDDDDMGRTDGWADRERLRLHRRTYLYIYIYIYMYLFHYLRLNFALGVEVIVAANVFLCGSDLCPNYRGPLWRPGHAKPVLISWPVRCLCSFPLRTRHRCIRIGDCMRAPSLVGVDATSALRGL